MVARTPPKQKKMLAALNPALIRETLNKVDRCMERLQELQYTVNGGRKVVSGINLSPRSTRVYLKTSLRCKQESLRIKNGGAARKSPSGKFPFPANTGEWKRMSLPAMLVGETVGEILQASQFARELVSAVGIKTAAEDPKTPLSSQRRPNQKNAAQPENTELKVRRKKEKQTKPPQRSDSPSSSLQKRARSRINFKVSPPKVREFDRENSSRYNTANKVSPRNKPWARKAVLFPNPLFSQSSSSQQQQFSKTRSPIISRTTKGTTTTPHKFLIKSPTSTSKVQVKIKGPQGSSPIRPSSLSRSRRSSPPRRFHLFHPPTVSVSSPTRAAIAAGLSRNSPKRSVAAKFRRSFSPSRLATRLVSPLKSRKGVHKSGDAMNGLKQHPASSTMQFPVPTSKNLRM